MASPKSATPPSALNNREDMAPTDTSSLTNKNEAVSTSETCLHDTAISPVEQNTKTSVEISMTNQQGQQLQKQQDNCMTYIKESIVESTYTILTTATTTTVTTTAPIEITMTPLIKKQLHLPSPLIASSLPTSIECNRIDNHKYVNNDNENANHNNYDGSSSNLQNNNSNNNNNKQRNHINADNECSSTAMVTMAAAANVAMQLRLLEAIKEVNCKQHSIQTVFTSSNEMRMDLTKVENSKGNNRKRSDELGKNLAKIFLSKSNQKLNDDNLQIDQSHLQVSPSNDENISNTESIQTVSMQLPLNYIIEQKRREEEEEKAIDVEIDHKNSSDAYKIYCKECGEHFENDFKLNRHILHEHKTNSSKADSNFQETNYMESEDSIKIKQELTELYDISNIPKCTESNILHPHSSNEKYLSTSSTSSSPSWLKTGFTSFNFPFLSRSTDTAITPLLELNTTGFTNIDGIQKSSLRIFNPEAFCELCNKEFCNKYFLKTHKANKHGINENTPEFNSNNSVNNIVAINHILQMQMQQKQQHQHQSLEQLNEEDTLREREREYEHKIKQEQQQKDIEQKTFESGSSLKLTPSRQLLTSPSAQIQCDICSKRFANIFALRRHQTKVHEQNEQLPHAECISSKINTSCSQSPLSLNAVSNENKLNDLQKNMIREFWLEQEYVSFTPQPRKLSPHSQQEAREYNFAYDKLKRLGVLNPDAFCKLCCKEYCNKYFLRTHKWKRHGIYMPPDTTGDGNDNYNIKSSFWPFINMPLNLMTSEENKKSSERDDGDGNEIGEADGDGCAETKNQNVNTNISERINDHLELSLNPTKRIKLEVESYTNPEVSQNNKKSENLIKVMDKQLFEVDDIEATNLGLQKLQTMIQQLSDINGIECGTEKKRLALMCVCHFCGQDMENEYALQNHIIREHNAILSKPQSTSQSLHHTIVKQSPNSSPNTSTVTTAPCELRCTACNEEFITLSEFHKHVADIHLLPVVGLEGFITPERSINTSSVGVTISGVSLANPRPPYTITPTSSYCEICNKELCNKYFMKTHMQRMHGIEIENGAQIGGVVCNICNKELCSKYFLRVHKHNTHGIIEDGTSILPQSSRQNASNFERQSPQNYSTSEVDISTPYRTVSLSPFASTSGCSGFSAESKLDILNTTHEICHFCAKRFRSTKSLRLHLQTDHSSQGAVEKTQIVDYKSNSVSKTLSPLLNVAKEMISSNVQNNIATMSNSQTLPGINNLNVEPSSEQLVQALRNLNAQHLKNSNQELCIVGQKSEQAKSQPLFKDYKCSLCSFTTPYYAFWYIHEKTHSITANNLSIVNDNTQKREDVLQQDHVEQQRQHEVQPDSSIENKSENGNTIAFYEKATPKSDNRIDISKSDVSKLNKIISNEIVDITTDADEIIECYKDSSALQFKNQQCLNETAIKADQIRMLRHDQNTNINSDITEITTPHMQTFILDPEIGNENGNNPFVSTIVCLPVKERLTKTVSITFKLTPKS